MGFDPYHEPPQELSEETRTYVRVIQSLIEEAEAIDILRNILFKNGDLIELAKHAEETIED
jgi:hypothetical protein